MREMHRKTRPSQWFLAAAVAALPALMSPPAVQAQQRVGSDGHALDANNRVGSNGRNNEANPNTGAVTGNQIVTGNVTGGREFRGGVPYTDPRAFRGGTAGVQIDRFISESSGAPVRSGVPTDLTVPQPFYGQSRAVPPPPGYTSEGYSGGFVPAPLPPIAPLPGDQRLGNVLPNPTIALPKPGELLLPGPVETSTNQPTLITASPLYGIRQWNPQEPTDLYFLSNYTTLGQENSLNQYNLSPEEIGQIRRQLQSPPGQSFQPNAPQNQTGQPNEPPASEAQPTAPLTNPLTPNDQPLTVNPLNSDANLTGSALSNSTQTDQGTVNRFVAPPTLQSGQYAQMRQRLLQLYQNKNLSDEQANRLFQEQKRLQELKQQQNPANNPALPTPNPTQGTTNGNKEGNNPPADTGILPGREPTTNPTGSGNPAGSGPLHIHRPTTTPSGAANVFKRPQPLQVESLATGVQAEDLSRLLKNAEKLMREGKYTSAADQYEAIEKAVPNNPLVRLGRANAELAGGYYAQADAHLRQAYGSDPTLMMAVYDLRQLIGSKRLVHIVTDLKEIAMKQPHQPRPLFLLAYISYNTHNPQMAAEYLNGAEQRTGHSDPLYTGLRDHWSLPATHPNSGDRNK